MLTFLLFFFHSYRSSVTILEKWNMFHVAKWSRNWIIRSNIFPKSKRTVFITTSTPFAHLWRLFLLWVTICGRKSFQWRMILRGIYFHSTVCTMRYSEQSKLLKANRTRFYYFSMFSPFLRGWGRGAGGRNAKYEVEPVFIISTITLVYSYYKIPYIYAIHA